MRFMKERGLSLVYFKIEFGRDKDGRLLVGDENNADSMRVWKESGLLLLMKILLMRDLNQISLLTEMKILSSI
ncbi:MAG: phosphoribosylaminoimidazolesuccinocarboxamide synthase, partial [Candidatus Odinarchaeota archaeon]